MHEGRHRSSSTTAPIDIQVGVHQRQYCDNGNIFEPTWAMMTDNSSSDIGKMRQAITGIYDNATEMMTAGALLEDVAGAYPNIAAIFDEQQFATSPIITQWAARMVRSIRLKCTLHFFLFGLK